LRGAFHDAALSGRSGSDSTVARARRIVHRAQRHRHWSAARAIAPDSARSVSVCHRGLPHFGAAAITRVMPFAAACSAGICAYAFSSFGTMTDSAAATLPLPSRTGTATPVVSG